jgi:ABC-type sugar transport system ATPase subunit
LEADVESLQIFFTGPAGCGKTFTLKLLTETYNRFYQSHNSLKMHTLHVRPLGRLQLILCCTTVHSTF